MEQSSHPYMKCLGGKGQIYLTDCLKPLADSVGDAEFSFCDIESVLSGGCLSARKMVTQMIESGFIVKIPDKEKKSKINRYALHPSVFRIIERRVNSVPTYSLSVECIT